MQDNVRREGAHRSLAPVSLPSRPPGTAHRLAAMRRPPTPPPRPESTFRQPPPGLSSPSSSRLSPPAVSDSAISLPAGGRLLPSSPSSSQSPPARPLLPLPSLLSMSDPLPLSTAGGILSSPPPAAAVISLTSPRTPAVRQQNLYVEAPVKKAAAVKGPTLQPQVSPLGFPRPPSSCQSLQSAVNIVNNNNNKQQRPGRLGPLNTSTTHTTTTTSTTIKSAAAASGGGTVVASSLLATTVISHQPSSGGSSTPGGTLKKCISSGPDLPPPLGTMINGSTAAANSGASSPSSASDSIICGACGRCRCAACRSPRPLPSAWLCDNSCLLSPESVVDTVSCMCCVKAGLYHCGEGLDLDTREEAGWVDHPCTCSPNQWLLRWGCLAAMSIPLPCLCCYPLLGGLTRLLERCYQSATNQGCRCPPDLHQPRTAAGGGTSPTASSPGADSQKRLLG